MQCSKFGFEITAIFKQSHCCICSDKGACGVRPRFELGRVDVFKLAEGLAEKRKWDALPQWAKEGKVGECPKCREVSLFYNKYEKKYECLNLRCPSNQIAQSLQ